MCIGKIVLQSFIPLASKKLQEIIVFVLVHFFVEQCYHTAFTVKYNLSNIVYFGFFKGTALLRCNEGTFRVRKIYGDGNCMFRAISYVLWRNEEEHQSLRTTVSL